jgi:RNA polymerase sigma-70 factor (ECF subfamily)
MADDLDARRLLAGVLRDDEEAARELVRQLYPLVRKIVRAHRPRRAAEEDLCQMIFIKIFQNARQYSGKAPLEHWVSRIAVNTCRNALAAEKARPELRRADLSEEESAVVDNLAATTEQIAPDRQLVSRDLVERLLGMLKPVERLVIDLLYLQEKSVKEIGAMTGWSLPLVKVRAFRARRKLKEQLARIEREGNGPARL